MPYTIKTDAADCKGFAVVDESGKTVGCHTTRKDAVSHQRALYSNVPEATRKEEPGVSGVHVDTAMGRVRVKKPDFVKSADVQTLVKQHDKLHSITDAPTTAQLFVHHNIMDEIIQKGADCDCSCGAWSQPLVVDNVTTDLDKLQKNDNPSLTPVKQIIQTGIDNGYKFADVLQMLDIGGYMMVVRPKEIVQEPTTEPTTVEDSMSKSILSKIKELLNKVGEPSLAGGVAEGGTATISGSITSLYKADEKRFTLGPWYIPDKKDAHGEWTDTSELQNALWNYVKAGDRRIRLQHNKSVVAGEWVEAMTWPYPVTVPMTKADGTSEDVTYPAGTVFMGTQWEPWAWELVKKGKLTGYSIGGKAERMLVDLPDEVTKYNPHHDNAGRFTSGGAGGGAGATKPSAGPRKGMGDIPITPSMAGEMKGGSAEPYLVQNENGEWEFTPERQALHDKIVQEAVDGKPSVENPVYTVMGGGPAAGKSTILKSGDVNIPEGSVEVNADLCKEKLPEWQTAGDNRAGITHEESSYLAKRTQAAAFERSQHVVLDGTGDTSPSSMNKKIDAARDAGYQVEAVYVTLPTDMAVKNAYNRGLETGRFVPEEVIRGTHAGVSETFPVIADRFDKVTLFDTSEMGKPKVIAKGGGGVVDILDQVAYDAFIAKGKAK
jgi:predicted ABC-type ATPase